MAIFFNLTYSKVTVNINKLQVIQEQHFLILSRIFFSLKSFVLITKSNDQT